MNQTLKKQLARHAKLTAKMLDGSINDVQKTELTSLTKAISKSTEPVQITRKTSLTTITLKEFKEQVEAMNSGEPSAEDVALAKQNLASVKKQGKTLEDDIVAIEVFAKSNAEETIAALEARLAVLEEKAQQPEDSTDDGDTDGDAGSDTDGDASGDTSDADADTDGDTDDTAKTLKADTEAPIAMALALEAITSVIGRMTALKAAFEAGNVDMDQVHKAWPNWDIRNMVDSAASIMTKGDEFKTLLDELTPKVDVVKGTSDTDTDGDKTDKADDDKTKKAADDEIKKAVEAFNSGRDMSPASVNGQGDFNNLRKHMDKDGTVEGFNRGTD